MLLAIPLAYILSASYVGLNGGQAWRQADVYAHILGFTGTKGFVAFEDFAGQRSIYDIPIYEYVIAKLSLLVRADPLVVTRYFNALLWLLTTYSGWRIVETFRQQAGIIFLFTIATSPLLLHYFSVPMPDTMALALSISALSLLVGRRLDRAGTALVCALLGTAALIKSPVPFVVLVFYVTWLGVSVLARSEDAIFRIRLQWRYVLSPLLVALVCAVLAETLRNKILGQELARFAQDPAWYFGALEMRASGDLWLRALERFQAASTRFLGAAYLGLFIIALYPAFKVNRTVVLAATAALISGWLVFPLLYRVHDYYQLPGTFLAYVGVAVAGRSIWDWATEKMPPLALGRVIRLEYEHLLMAGLLCYSVAASIAMREISELRRTSVYDALEYALRDQEWFLYVDDDRKFKENIGPAIGGWASTRFRQINHGEFEGDCERWLNEFPAVLVKGASECLAQQRSRASFYFAGDGYLFLLLEVSQAPKTYPGSH